MPNRLTPQQVIDQKNRFDKFIETTDLTKIGRKYLHFLKNDSKDGKYTPYCYISRILSICANVGYAYTHPNLDKFYVEILKSKALNAYINTFGKPNPTTTNQ